MCPTGVQYTGVHESGHHWTLVSFFCAAAELVIGDRLRGLLCPSDYESGGRRFESFRARQIYQCLIENSDWPICPEKQCGQSMGRLRRTNLMECRCDFGGGKNSRLHKVYYRVDLNRVRGEGGGKRNLTAGDATGPPHRTPARTAATPPARTNGINSTSIARHGQAQAATPRPVHQGTLRSVDGAGTAPPNLLRISGWSKSVVAVAGNACVSAIRGAPGAFLRIT